MIQLWCPKAVAKKLGLFVETVATQADAPGIPGGAGGPILRGRCLGGVNPDQSEDGRTECQRTNHGVLLRDHSPTDHSTHATSPNETRDRDVSLVRAVGDMSVLSPLFEQRKGGESAGAVAAGLLDGDQESITPRKSSSP